jgi:hypothetical protein
LRRFFPRKFCDVGSSSFGQAYGLPEIATTSADFRSSSFGQASAPSVASGSTRVFITDKWVSNASNVASDRRRVGSSMMVKMYVRACHRTLARQPEGHLPKTPFTGDAIYRRRHLPETAFTGAVYRGHLPETPFTKKPFTGEPFTAQIA